MLSHRDKPEQICAALAHYGIAATLTENVRDAILVMESHASTFLLLDLELDEADSLFEQAMSRLYPPLPYILAVDAFPNSAARIRAFNRGADSCLKKPVDAEEVLAIIQAASRREEHLHWMRTVAPIQYGELSIDPLRRSVSMRKEPVYLTSKEFGVLYLLVSNPGIVFSKPQIYERVWKSDFEFATTSVSDHISSLRRKLGLNAKDGRYIQTVFGTGYRFVPE